MKIAEVLIWEKEEDTFIQSFVSIGADYQITCCYEFQLRLLTLACTDRKNKTILSFDTTFKLGDFFLTTSVFKLMWFKEEPMILGPILISTSIKERDYGIFLKVIKSKDKNFEKIIATGVILKYNIYNNRCRWRESPRKSY